MVVPNWNGELWLEKCIISLINQTYVDTEIIIVDNASTDCSITLLQKYKENLILVCNQTNEGFASAINKGVEIARGTYIFILNNDAWIEEDFIENAVLEIQQLKLSVLGFAEAEYSSDLPSHNISRLTIDFLGHPIRTLNDKKCFYLGGHGLLFKKDTYLESGGLDGQFFMYFEEVDWFWRLNLYQIPFAESKKLYVHHKKHGSSEAFGTISYSRFLWRNENVLIMLLKNYSIISLLFLLPCYFLINLVEIFYFVATRQYKIAYSYILGPFKTLKKIKHICQSRQVIQGKRLVKDWDIFKKMYFGPAKLMHLKNFKLKNLGVIK